MKKIKVILTLLLTFSILLASCGVSSGDTIMEYNGEKLGERLYSFWAAKFKRNILNLYSDVEDKTDYWNSEYKSGITVAEFFDDLIKSQIKNYLISQKLFKEYNLKLSDEIIQQIDDDITEKIEFSGSRTELNEELAEMGINIELLREAYIWQAKHDAVYSYLFGHGGPKEATSEQIQNYYESNYSLIDYIVVYKTKLVYDENGNLKYDSEGNVVTEEMTESEAAEALMKADEAFMLADGGEDFTALMKEYSDYDLSELYSRGLFVSANELATYGYGIVSAVQSGKPGEVYRVEEEAAYYIIKERELTSFEKLNDEDLLQLSNLESYCIDELYSQYFSELAENVKTDDDKLKSFSIAVIKASPSSIY